jgi:transposase
MKKEDILSTLFVGIDVSSKSNVVRAIDFFSTIHLAFEVENNHPGAVQLVNKLAEFLRNSDLYRVVIAMEATSIYSTHIACFLSTARELIPFKAEVYCLNPKTTSNYKKSFIDIGKTDPVEAFVIADFARVGRIKQKPWRGSQFLALQRLTRHRLHLAESIAREKSYMLTNIFLKFSELALSIEDKPFSDTFGATAEAVLKEFLSTDDIVGQTPQELVDFVNDKGRGHFANPEHTAKVLRQAASNSYKLDKCLYEPLTISIASSFNCVSAFEREMKTINKAITKAVKGLNPTEHQCLLSIPGIGPVYSSGILAEIGTIANFKNEGTLAKYAGLVWHRPQSGDFEADDSYLSKAGNSYLRYYLIQAANCVRRFEPEYAAFYAKKYAEATTHKHTRAIALTARKLIRLIFGLLGKNQLYSPQVAGGKTI